MLEFLTRLPILSFFLVTAFYARPVLCETLGGFLGRLTAMGQQTRTLEARFQQRKLLSLFRTEVKTDGVMYFRRPKELRWETYPPDASVLLVIEQRAELRLPGEKPLAMELKDATAAGTLIEQLLLWLGVRPADTLTREYQVKYHQNRSLTRLELAPRGGILRERITSLDLEFGADLILRRIKILQRDGDAMRVDFFSVKRNSRLPANCFR